MKFHRKLRGDEAVSPVIAVILMVAITVVLAATVYVWVSGFGNQGNQPAKTLSLTTSGTIQSVDLWDGAGWATDGTADHYRKTYSVSAAMPGLRYGDLAFTIDGRPLALAINTVPDPDVPYACNFPADYGAATHPDPATHLWSACAGATARGADDVIAAGDQIVFQYNEALAGKTLRVLDSQANSVILTLTIG